jgi:hypothetical protein
MPHAPRKYRPGAAERIGEDGSRRLERAADLIRSRGTERRNLAAVLARGRVAIGVASVLAPGLVARTMTGREGSRSGGSLFAGMVGARDAPR